MRKLKFYIETSTINFANSDQVPYYKEATLKFFRAVKSGEYEGYTSEVVLREINRAISDIGRFGNVSHFGMEKPFLRKHFDRRVNDALVFVGTRFFVDDRNLKSHGTSLTEPKVWARKNTYEQNQTTAVLKVVIGASWRRQLSYALDERTQPNVQRSWQDL